MTEKERVGVFEFTKPLDEMSDAEIDALAGRGDVRLNL
jgi:hypothetical protein